MPDLLSEPALDHVVIAARNHDDITTRLDELGLAPGSGRAMTGTGLSNVVVAIGTQLLELHYPDGTAVDAGGPPFAGIEQRVLGEHPDVDLVPVAWLVRYASEHSLRAASRRVDCPVTELPPEPPNNAGYLLGGFGPAFTRPWLPAFIHWTRPPHLPPPLADDHDGPNEGWIGLDVSGPEEELREWCGALPAGVRVEAGTAGPQRVRIHRTDVEPAIVGLP